MILILLRFACTTYPALRFRGWNGRGSKVWF